MLRSFLQGELFGSIYGRPPVEVVALHGWRRDHTDYEQLGSLWMDDCAIIAPDLPGFGATPPPGLAWDSAQYAKLISILIEDEIGAPVVVLGHSFGGRVAVRLAASRPDLVKSLVLTGAPLAAPRSTTQRQKKPQIAITYRVARQMEKLGLVSVDRMERIRKRYGSPDYAHASGIMRKVLVNLLAETYSDDLAKFACSVHLVWGEEDTEVPIGVARSIAHAVPGSQLTELPGIGHFVPTDAPTALAKVVEAAVLASRS